MAIQGLFHPTSTRQESQSRRTPKLQSFFQFLAFNFSFITWVLLGACVQGVILLVFRNAYALVPAVALLLIRFIDSCLMAFNLKTNIYMEGALKQKVSALSVDGEGNFTDAPASEKIAVLLLGAKSNHPFGFFAPGFKELGEHMNAMTVDLEGKAADNGFLGQTAWTRYDERGALEVTSVSYWRSLEDIHDFAHSPVHRVAWQWWEKTLKEHDCIGINHEIFEADRGRWENVYVNFQPTGLGATTFLKRGGVGGSKELVGGVVADEWISPLVDVSRGKLSKSSGRLGWDPTKHDARSPAIEAIYADRAPLKS